MINYNNGMMSPNCHMDRVWGVASIAAVVGATAGIATGIGGMVSAGQNRRDAKAMAKEAKIERDKQQKILEKQKKEYKTLKFENPFSNMENVFEDLTVNQQQAEFQAQQGSQQRANIMQNLKGAAGSSGIAGLAQALANQGQLQTQRISASIGLQESSNQMATAKGAASIQAAERQGDQWVQQANIDRQATLLGMQMGATSGANMAYQQSQANQMNAQIAQQQAMLDFGGTVASAAGSFASTKASTTCFAKGDEIEMFSGIIKAIELIKIGDEVKSIKDNKVVKGIVTNTLIHPTNDIVEVVKINGITAEPKHPVFVDNKWILIGELETITYQFIDNWYNLEIDSNTGDSEHNYIIGGLIASGLGDNIELNKKYQRQPKELTQHLDVEFKQI